MDRKVLLWSKKEKMGSTEVIWVREGCLYKASGHSTQALVHSTINLCELWHQRFSKVTGMPEFPYEHDGICKGCSLGKNIKKSFPKSNNRSQGTLDIIHSDKCEPMTSPSLSDFLYYVFFIDYSSRKSWIYFLKVKS